jgi:hypothetical protein
MKNAASHIVRMILDCVDHSNKSQVGLLGQILLEHANKVENEEIEGDEDPDLVRKMRVLKRAEDECDLFWIDYKSWNCFSVTLKKQFEEALNPLFWGGVFCKYSDFQQNESKILSRLPVGVVANLIQHRQVYQLFCVSCDAKEYHMMGIQDFESLQETIFASLLRSYCRVNNDIVVKEFSYKDVQGKRHKHEDHPASASL